MAPAPTGKGSPCLHSENEAVGDDRRRCHAWPGKAKTDFLLLARSITLYRRSALQRRLYSIHWRRQGGIIFHWSVMLQSSHWVQPSLCCFEPALLKKPRHPPIIFSGFPQTGCIVIFVFSHLPYMAEGFVNYETAKVLRKEHRAVLANGVVQCGSSWGQRSGISHANYCSRQITVRCGLAFKDSDRLYFFRYQH
jgi:hypothetical protein